MILPQNQYNSQGIFHNLALDSMPSMVGFPALTTADFYNQALSLFNEVYYNSFTSPSYSDCSTYMTMISDGDTSTVIINQLHTDGYISSALQSVLISFMNMLNAETNFTTWDADMNGFIATVPGMSSLSDVEKECCYGIGSTALFSAYYWNNVAANPSNPWYAGLGGGLPPTFIKIITAIGADCLGMAIGFGVGTLLADGPGALIGMGCCGAGASAAAVK